MRTVQRCPQRIKVSKLKLSPVLVAKNAATLARREAHLHIALHVRAGFPNGMQAVLALLAALQLLHHPRLEHLVLFQLLTAVIHDLEVMVQVRIRRDLHPHDLHVAEQVVVELLKRNAVLFQLLRQKFLDEAVAIEDASIDLFLRQHLGRVVVEFPLEDGRKGSTRMLTAIEMDTQVRVPGKIDQSGVFQVRSQ
ncbi:hypothetical protein D3C76_1283890 [compost metagenome]